MDYSSIKDWISGVEAEYLSSPRVIIEVIVISGLFLLAKIFTRKIRGYFGADRALLNTRRSFEEAVNLLLFPLISLLLIAIFAGLIDSKLLPFFAPAKLTEIVSKIILIWLLVRTIRLLSNSRLMAILLSILIIPPIVLDIFDLLEPITEYLDSLSFTVGKAKITAYIIIKSIIVITVLLWLTYLFAKASERYIRSIGDLRANIKELIVKSLMVTVFTIGFLIALNIIGVDLTALAVFGGALSVGIGFGLQKIVANLVSGIFLLVEDSVKLDDILELEGGTFAYVRKLGARYTLVETFDGLDVLIPNEELITQKVKNWTHAQNLARIKIAVTVSYQSDARKAQELMLEAANSHKDCLKKPEAECFLREFLDNGVRIELYFWIGNIIKGRFTPQSEVMHSIISKFKDNNIDFAYVVTDIRIRNASELISRTV